VSSFASAAADVRAAVAAWFGVPAIPGVTRVYADQPWWAAGPSWDPLDATAGYGCIAFPHISDQQEVREAFGGATGGLKMVRFQVGLVVLYKWTVPQVLPPGQDESAWVGPLDAVLEAIVERLRSDRTLGGAVWQAGEAVGADIKIGRDLPRLDKRGGTIQSWQVVEFTVDAPITA